MDAAWEQMVDYIVGAYNDIVVEGQHTFFVNRPDKSWYDLADEGHGADLPVCFQVYRARLDAAFERIGAIPPYRTPSAWGDLHAEENTD